MTLPDNNRGSMSTSSLEGGRRGSAAGDLTYSMAMLVYSVVRIIPVKHRVRALDVISRYLAGLIQMANPGVVKAIRQNYRAFVTGDGSEMQPTALRRLLSLIVWNSLMLNSLPVLPWSEIADLAHVEGLSYLDDSLKSGAPVLIWSYHFGLNPLIVAAILHARGYPVHAVSHAHLAPDAATFIHRFYLSYVHGIGDRLSVIDPRKGIQRALLDVLKAKECLYLTPDYFLTEGEVQQQAVSFIATASLLNGSVRLQTGGMRLAKRLKARVVTILPTRIDSHARHLLIQPFTFPTSGLKPPALREDLQAGLRLLEAGILAHPFWWLDLRRHDLVQRIRSK